MNKKRRNELKRAINYIETALEIVNTIHDMEEDAMYNYPENLQGTETYEKMENAVDNMDEAAGLIDEGVDSLRGAIDLLEEAAE